MRICLVSHGFPPLETTGVENYTAALARALVGAGHTVEVFTPRIARELPDLSLRREERDGYGLSWLTTNTPPTDQAERLDLPGVANRFGDFLDRERPQVIHFQHVIKLGLSLVEQARERGIPTLYTAHDYYPVCHRFTLMRPDLERCETVGDSELCSRCDLALSFLDRQDNLGDYQIGVLPEQLGQEQFRALQRILAGDPEAAGFSTEEQAAFAEKRAALDQKRGEAYQKFERILSPTRFLADRLIEGGIAAERIQVLTYGAETANLESLERPRRVSAADRELPLRFGYIGGLSKHKGVHILAEAFASLAGRARLAIWGGSSDTKYAELVRRSAVAAGAELRGPFRRSQLADCLAEVDVVVVPSIWVENYPFAIREAFAAGRPVITCDVGALSESVRHEVDGLRVPPGNPGALAAAMARFLDEPELLGRLVAGIDPVKSIDAQVAELVPIYESLVDDDPESADDHLPSSVRAIRERYREMSSMPLRDLFSNVLGNLSHVRTSLCGPAGEDVHGPAAVELPVDALMAGSHAQVQLRDLKREKDWLRSAISSYEKTETALRERLTWRESELDARESEAGWLKQLLEDTKKSLDTVREENTWLRNLVRRIEGEVQDAREESIWLHDLLDERKRESGWLRDTLVAYERDMSWQREKIESQTEALAEANQAHIRDYGILNEAHAALHETNAALHAENTELKRRASEERAHLQDILRGLGVLGPEDPATLGITDDQAQEGEESPGADPEVQHSKGHRQIVRLLSELRDRRYEMQAALDDSNRALAQILLKRTGLGRRVSGWRNVNGRDDAPSTLPRPEGGNRS